MSLEEQFREQIIIHCSGQLAQDIRKAPIQIVNELPSPEELGREGNTLQPICKVMERFIYAVRKGSVLVMLLCALVEAPGLSVRVPSNFDFINHNGNGLRNGETEIIQDPEYKTDTFVVLRFNWIGDPDLYNKDHIEIEKGDLTSLYALDARLYPATGTAASVTSGTTAVTGYGSK